MPLSGLHWPAKAWFSSFELVSWGQVWPKTSCYSDQEVCCFWLCWLCSSSVGFHWTWSIFWKTLRFPFTVGLTTTSPSYVFISLPWVQPAATPSFTVDSRGKHFLACLKFSFHFANDYVGMVEYIWLEHQQALKSWLRKKTWIAWLIVWKDSPYSFFLIRPQLRHFLDSLELFLGWGSGWKTFFGTYLCRQSTLLLWVQPYLFVFNSATFGASSGLFFWPFGFS